jgi:hypothetical protein
LNPCVAHCSTDSIPWVHHSREEGSLDYDGGFVCLQIHMNFDTIIYCQQWYSLLSPGVIHGWEDLKQRILSNFQGFQCPELTESDIFSCKQKDKEPLQNYFRRFVHLRAQAPNVLDVVAINVAIVGLRAGQFRSHLMRKRPKTIQRLYEEFEKYYRSDNDFRMCRKSSLIKRSLLKPISPMRGNDLIPGMLRMLTPYMSLA